MGVFPPRWGEAVGRRGQHTGVAAAFLLSPLAPSRPPPPPHGNPSPLSQEQSAGKRGVGVRGTCLVPPFCLLFQMTQLPSNGLPQECPPSYNTLTCIKLQSYICPILQGIANQHLLIKPLCYTSEDSKTKTTFCFA